MSGMDRLTEMQVSNQTLEWLLSSKSESFEMDASAAQSMAREILAHRRASQAAPSPSDGLLDALCENIYPFIDPDDAGSVRSNFEEILTRAALTPTPAQEKE